MATLTREQEQIIVIWLACYLSVEEVVAELARRFDIAPTAAELTVYDPTGIS